MKEKLRNMYEEGLLDTTGLLTVCCDVCEAV